MPEWKSPGFMAKITGFVVAYADWAKEGYPRRSAEWVDEIFAEHCQPCEHYAPETRSLFGDKGVCSVCSCHVSANAENMRNKVVLPSQSCPVGKWQANIGVRDKTQLKIRKGKT